MKSVFIVYSDYGNCIDHVFDSYDKAIDYIMSQRIAEKEMIECECENWEDYFEFDPCDVAYGLSKYDVE